MITPTGKGEVRGPSGGQDRNGKGGANQHLGRVDPPAKGGQNRVEDKQRGVQVSIMGSEYQQEPYLEAAQVQAGMQHHIGEGHHLPEEAETTMHHGAWVAA